MIGVDAQRCGKMKTGLWGGGWMARTHDVISFVLVEDFKGLMSVLSVKAVQLLAGTDSSDSMTDHSWPVSYLTSVNRPDDRLDFFSLFVQRLHKCCYFSGLPHLALWQRSRSNSLLAATDSRLLLVPDIRLSSHEVVGRKAPRGGGRSSYVFTRGESGVKIGKDLADNETWGSPEGCVS
jgi:hypothetical protein